MVGDPAIPVTGRHVGVARVGEQAQAVVEERSPAGVRFVVLGEAVFDVGESVADTVVVTLQGGQIDGFSEVGGEDLQGDSDC
ncbi:hypothetical protein SDC9_81215 [bioreactor metagenome]|jgi:hypothetical protein|uniref:Uncharacterized protein n=1 Tax=bioreactor metagenome TaxID=1076179 RepID=A0A644Z245_9ZZZZ|nr:hypothetical protein [Propionibacterium sp.]